MSDQQQVEALRQGDQGVLRKLYQTHRSPFLSWARLRYSIQEEDLLDIFQESIIVFYQNVQEGKIQTLNCSIKTYLFSVGKNLIFKQYKIRQQTVLKEEIDEQLIDQIDTQVYDEIELNHQQKILRSAFSQLGDTCRELLTLFYYREFAMESIATRLGYKNTDTVKSQKRRCMQQLETLLDTIQKPN